jgi:deoxyadenosine/deoxycytidine kinase
LIGTGAVAKKFIAVAGNIGVGKTSLVEFLCNHYGFLPFVEPNINNPYLDDFYKDFSAWAFHSQIYFLTHKFRLHKELERCEATVVQDRTIYEDAEIFARNLYRSRHMTKRDFNTYMELYAIMRRELAPPDLMIYLKCPVSAIKKRIKLRGRPNEQNIPEEYLVRLNRLYEDWFKGYDLSPVLVWPTHKMDYLTDLVDHINFLKSVEAFL